MRIGVGGGIEKTAFKKRQTKYSIKFYHERNGDYKMCGPELQHLNLDRFNRDMVSGYKDTVPEYKATIKIESAQTAIERFQVTCPECGENSFWTDERITYCPGCEFDMGGWPMEKLKAVDKTFVVSFDRLTGDPVILPESA